MVAFSVDPRRLITTTGNARQVGDSVVLQNPRAELLIEVWGFPSSWAF